MSQETERYQLENNGNTYLARASASGGGGTEVVANPEGTATTDLEKLKVGETIYGIPEGTNVVANPTLAGTESALTGLEVGDTKYKVDSGMTNPMTTQYDMIVAGANGTPTRLYDDDPNLYNKFITRTNSSPVWSPISASMVIVGSSNKRFNVPYVTDNSNTSTFGIGKPASTFGLGTITIAPTANNTDGLKIVVLTSEPATRYNGYLYIITA